MITGLNSTILNLQWPEEVDPAKLADFETQARKLRYRALGAACRDSGINALLVAHHEDDVAETMLRNILRVGHSQATWNLRAMTSGWSNIPECWGMHGVHESGFYETKGPRVEALRSDVYPTDKSKPLTSGDQCLRFEGGGVKVYRPLLAFSKARLEATCRQHDLNWVEDETNHDVTRTTRNAIRSLLKAARLPKALSKSNLLALNDRAKSTLQKIEQRAETLLRQANITMLDVRSGGLVIQLPHLPLDDLPAGLTFLKRVFEIVSPLERISTASMSIALSYMPSSGPGSIILTKERMLGLKCFSGGGVFAEPVRLPIEPASDRSISGDLPANSAWLLTRQLRPHPQNPDPSSILKFNSISPPARSSIATSQPHNHRWSLDSVMDQNSSQGDSAQAGGPWSPWKLWDGRFWIRISNRTGRELEVRTFCSDDWKHLKSDLPKAKYKDLCHNLSMTAPDFIRWTLPVIAINAAPRKVLAFPTLSDSPSAAVDGLEWEVRYKSVDVGFKGKLDPERIAR